MTGTAQFPQRALLLGVLWFPATFLVLWACAALGMWSSHHMEAQLAVFFAGLSIFAFALQIKVVVPAIALLRSHANMRLPINYLLLAIGALTAVIAAGFVLVFGVIALNNQQGTVTRSNYALERSATGSSDLAAGARTIIAPAAHRPRLARPAQRGRLTS